MTDSTTDQLDELLDHAENLGKRKALLRFKSEIDKVFEILYEHMLAKPHNEKEKPNEPS